MDAFPSSPVLQAKGELPGELNAPLRKAAAYLPAFAGSLQAARRGARCGTWKLGSQSCREALG